MNDNYIGSWPDNDYRYYLEHSIKGQQSKTHKYISRKRGKSGRWIYEYSSKSGTVPSRFGLGDLFGKNKKPIHETVAEEREKDREPGIVRPNKENRPAGRKPLVTDPNSRPVSVHKKKLLSDKVWGKNASHKPVMTKDHRERLKQALKKRGK